MAGFPIFLELGQIPPLVVGGGPLAAVKARTLLLRAARVSVAAVRIGPELSELAAKGLIEHLAIEPAARQIRGRPMVISATGDLNEDARVSGIARAFGVPVNVPDRPEFCTFSLPAIVDRFPVTIAIGTEGMAPVLATRLRGQLEQSIDPGIGRLAAVAGDFRRQVSKVLPAGVARREFWRGVFEGPAAAAIADGRESDGRALIADLLAGGDASDAKPQGRVILVGAGPGDPELLTLKAVRALKSADVILADQLPGQGVLGYARREAEIVSVGKAKGRHSRSQAEINALMVGYAREGKTVVRLKGGDPFVFGRGGEEIDILRASGIAVEVVPGITAAVACAASLQVPLTHRECSRSVTFVSGHAAGDGAPEFDQVDFSALAKGHNTLCVYMGVATAGVLAATLLAAGWSPATPVMAVERATQAAERRVATTLDVLADDPTCLALAGPALLICGEVAGLDAAGTVERVERARTTKTAETEKSATEMSDASV